jgi:hypothetical protein
VTDEILEARVLRTQDEALARLRAVDFAGQTIAHVEQVLAMPVRTSVAVAPDFWRQFQLADELDAIRETRPSAFQALPAAPGRRTGPSPTWWIARDRPSVGAVGAPGRCRRRSSPPVARSVPRLGT